jgi:tetratricopeptide (TPR) repeat protein
MLKTIIPYLFLMLFSALGSKAQVLEAGKLIPEVFCMNDSNHHYALYLPSYFYESDMEEWPVIYAFDAAARGALPVELFSEAAEKYGYIIAGSNVSENGPWEPILKAAETMFKDTEARFKIDPKRRYTTGFSGGARVATSLAVLYGTFEGVIGCGAGFSNNYPSHFDLEFSYIGIIGNRDFNYQELENLDYRLDKYQISHYIYEFPGEHDWPPEQIITDAVTWLEFRAMENDLKWTDYGLREDFYQASHQLILDLIREGREYDASVNCEKLISYLHGVRNVSEIESLLETLNKTDAVLKEKKNLARVLSEERNYYLKYADAFVCYRINYEDSMTPVKPYSWWREQIKIANSKIVKAENPIDTLLGRRMIDFIWRTAFIQYESVQGTEYQPTSRYFLDIWAMAQPDAISPYFFLAKYYTRQGRYDKALKSLENAIDRGLSDINLIESDSTLVNLSMMTEYQRVVAKIEIREQ